MASPAARHFLLCVVTNHKPDVSLVCAMNLLRTQSVLMSLPSPCTAEVHFVDSHDDALNLLWQLPAAEGALIVEGHVGLPPEFLTAALESGRRLVVAAHPLPVVDWDRVKSAPADEDPAHWGNVYNVTPRTAAPPDRHGHVEAERVATLGGAWVRREVLTDIAARHPEVVEAGGRVGAFATAGVYDGERLDGVARFLRLQGGPVWADVARQASCTGVAEFGGAVAQRAVLR